MSYIKSDMMFISYSLSYHFFNYDDEQSTLCCERISDTINLIKLCYVMLCYVMLCYVILCYVCYVILCYILFCYVMLCYVMLCYVMYPYNPNASAKIRINIIPIV